jgi:hypothetical protein
MYEEIYTTPFVDDLLGCGFDTRRIEKVRGKDQGLSAIVFDSGGCGFEAAGQWGRISFCDRRGVLSLFTLVAGSRCEREVVAPSSQLDRACGADASAGPSNECDGSFHE